MPSGRRRAPARAGRGGRAPPAHPGVGDGRWPHRRARAPGAGGGRGGSRSGLRRSVERFARGGRALPCRHRRRPVAVASGQGARSQARWPPHATALYRSELRDQQSLDGIDRLDPGFNPAEVYETAIANLAPELDREHAGLGRGGARLGKRAPGDGRGSRGRRSGSDRHASRLEQGRPADPGGGRVLLDARFGVAGGYDRGHVEPPARLLDRRWRPPARPAWTQARTGIDRTGVAEGRCRARLPREGRPRRQDGDRRARVSTAISPPRERPQAALRLRRLGQGRRDRDPGRPPREGRARLQAAGYRAKLASSCSRL